MIKKILLIPALLLSTNTFAKTEWLNDIYAEKSSYSYSSSVMSDNTNRFEYRCSVLKLNDNKFAKIDSLNVDLDLKLEEDKLSFQEKYKVNLIFSSGREYKNTLPLKSGFNGSDRFTFYLNSQGADNDEIVNGLLFGNYVNVEVVDNNKKRMLYRFYLKGSKKSITKAKSDCELLFKTFK